MRSLPTRVILFLWLALVLAAISILGSTVIWTFATRTEVAPHIWWMSAFTVVPLGLYYIWHFLLAVPWLYRLYLGTRYRTVDRDGVTVLALAGREIGPIGSVAIHPPRPLRLSVVERFRDVELTNGRRLRVEKAALVR